MNENYIIVDNIETNEIEEAIMNLANLYADTGYTDGIQIFRKKMSTTSFLILFSNTPDFECFNYFVNYIRYPNDLETINPIVKGYFQTKTIKNSHDFKIGEWIVVYVSKNDKEYDNVSIVNENNETYLYDFGGGIKRLTTIEVPFDYSEISLEDYNHIIDIYPSDAFESSSKPWWKFW